MDNEDQFLPRINEAKIDTLKEDIEANKNLLEIIKDNFTEHKFTTNAQLSDVSYKVDKLTKTLDHIDIRLDKLKDEMPFRFNLSNLVTKENLAIATAAIIFLNITVSTFRGEDTSDQLKELTELLNNNED